MNRCLKKRISKGRLVFDISSSGYKFAKAKNGVSGEKTYEEVSASIKKVCRRCKVIHRNGGVRVICMGHRHKQRQGYIAVKH